MRRKKQDFYYHSWSIEQDIEDMFIVFIEYKVTKDEKMHYVSRKISKNIFLTLKKEFKDLERIAYFVGNMTDKEFERFSVMVVLDN